MALFLGVPSVYCRRFQSPMEMLLGDLLNDSTPNPLAGTYATPDLLLQLITTRQSKAGTKQPWIQVFNMRGFTEKEINLTINEDSVIINAKHEEVEGGNIDKYEKIRTIKIPKDIDREKISGFLNSDGRFFVKGLHIKKDPQEVKPERVTEGAEVKQTDKEIEEKISSEDKAASGEGSATADKSGGGAKSLADFLCDALSESLNDSAKNGADDFVTIGDGNPHFGTELSVQDKSVTPLSDTQEIVEKDGGKQFQVKVNLAGFAPENISIRCQGNTLYVDAKKEVETEKMYKFQEFHREYAVPENGTSKEAKATVSDKGMVCINVPIVEAKEHVELPIAHQ